MSERSTAGPLLINLTHLSPGMAGVARHSAGLVGALLRRDDVPPIQVVTTPGGLAVLSDFGLDLSPDVVTLLPASIGRSKVGAAVTTLGALPLMARRQRASTVLSLDYYVSPTFGSTRTLTMVTDVQYLDRPASFSRGGRWSRACFLRLGARRADAVLGISQTSIDRYLDAFPAAEGRTVIVNMGIDVPTTHTTGERNDTALFVGTTNTHKNLGVVIDAVRSRQLTSIDVVIAGRPGSGEPALQAALRDPAVASRVQRLGRVTDDDLGNLYRRADLLIAPSLYEGFDMPTVEAMAAGAHVVASDLPVHREILGGHAVYFDAHDPTSLAAAVKIARERTTAERCAAAAHARTYSWDRSAAQLAAVL